MVAVVAVVDEIRLVVAQQVAAKRNDVRDPVALAQQRLGTAKATVDRHATDKAKGSGAVKARCWRVGARCHPQHITTDRSGQRGCQILGVAPRSATTATFTPWLHINHPGSVGWRGREGTEDRQYNDKQHERRRDNAGAIRLHTFPPGKLC